MNKPQKPKPLAVRIYINDYYMGMSDDPETPKRIQRYKLKSNLIFSSMLMMIVFIFLVGVICNGK